MLEFYFNHLWHKKGTFTASEQVAVMMMYFTFRSTNAFREICYYIKIKYKLDLYDYVRKIDGNDDHNRIPSDWRYCLHNLLKRISRWNDNQIASYMNSMRTREKRKYLRNYSKTKLSKLLWIIGNHLAQHDLTRNDDGIKLNYEIFQAMDDILETFPFLFNLYDLLIIRLRQFSEALNDTFIDNKLNVLLRDLHFTLFLNRTVCHSEAAFMGTLKDGMRRLCRRNLLNEMKQYQEDELNEFTLQQESRRTWRRDNNNDTIDITSFRGRGGYKNRFGPF